MNSLAQSTARFNETVKEATHSLNRFKRLFLLSRTVGIVMDMEAIYDCALRSAESWRKDAELYTGSRKLKRLLHAERFEKIAEEILETV